MYIAQRTRKAESCTIFLFKTVNTFYWFNNF